MASSPHVWVNDVLSQLGHRVHHDQLAFHMNGQSLEAIARVYDVLLWKVGVSQRSDNRIHGVKVHTCPKIQPGIIVLERESPFSEPYHHPPSDIHAAAFFPELVPEPNVWSGV